MSQTLPLIEATPPEDDLSLGAAQFSGSDHGVTGAVDAPIITGAFTSREERESRRSTVVDLAIPVYNEADVLPQSIGRLRDYLDNHFPFATEIVIVDNASTDQTWEVAQHLASTVPGVSALALKQKGKGRAVRAAWSQSTAEIVAYMDVDLSTDLGAFLPLIAPLLSRHSEVAIGSRFAPGAHVLRGARREVVSRGYNSLLRIVLGSGFSDATCGFKAARREAIVDLLPLVDDEHWFFDTELLVVAERNGCRIHEVPVDWIDDADSRVNVKSVASEDLAGIARLVRNRAKGNEVVVPSAHRTHRLHLGQRTRYCGVGILSTLAYLILFFSLRDVWGAYAANVTALALTTIANTIAHARFTFGQESGMGLRQATQAGCAAFVAAVIVTTLALGVEAWVGTTSVSAETLAILAGVVVSVFVRLVLLRSSAYRAYTHSQRQREPA